MRHIHEIIKIKNCPSFVDFSPSPDLPSFARYNLLYGWNGSGKTTLSRILRSFELARLSGTHTENQSEFKFLLDDKSVLSESTLTDFNNIRVFNKDFIEETIFCTGGPKPIFYLGTESKEAHTSIVQTEEALAKLRSLCDREKSLFSQAKKNKERLLKTKSQEIKNTLTTSIVDTYRNYDTRDLLARLESPQKYTELDNEQVTEIKKTISQSIRGRLEHISVPEFDITPLHREIVGIATASLTSHIIQELKEDTEIAKWVEKGIDLHKTRNRNECAFCGQQIPPGRMSKLADHFNDEYRKIIETIQKLKLSCNSLRTSPHFPEVATLYEELAKEYLEAKNNAERATSAFNKTLDSLIRILEQKEENIFLELRPEEIPVLNTRDFVEINKIIDRHNEKTKNFEQQIKQQKERLEAHLIAQFMSLHDEQEYQSQKASFEDSELALRNKEKEIAQLKTNLLSHQIATGKINKDLKSFLGREDLELKPLETEGGYQITRNGEVACNLSEGERTAIAIVYFLAKLGETGFNRSTGVIVIDDPISSLDSHAVFQAFSFIRESIQDSAQVFILTHHFDFFKRVRNWFAHEKDSAFFMIVCKSEKGLRKSYIHQLDKLLREYESEYHFLFNIIHTYANNRDCELKDLYPIPNIARKFLESFLAFRVPLPSLNSFERLKELKSADDRMKSRVLDFLATHSHARYESGVQDIDLSILTETHDVMNDLLDIVKKEDPAHFNYLLQSISTTSSAR